ncbi:MAG: hypothetical protein QM820_65090 [Minicystis sp.]
MVQRGWTGGLLALSLLVAAPAAAAAAQPKPAPAAITPAPAPAPVEPGAPDSPRASVKRFLDLCRVGEYAEAAVYLDLAEAQKPEGAQLARRLKAVLDRQISDRHRGHLAEPARRARGQAPRRRRGDRHHPGPERPHARAPRAPLHAGGGALDLLARHR